MATVIDDRGTVIVSFQGEHRFLSNFWYLPDGRTVEHYYQAAKAANPTDATAILACGSPGEAKRAGQRIQLRPDWDWARKEVMLDLQRKKYAYPELRALLLATGDAHIQEGNTWRDTFWGVDINTGEGMNWLGRILMQVRAEIRAELALGSAWAPPTNLRDRDGLPTWDARLAIGRFYGTLPALFDYVQSLAPMSVQLRDVDGTKEVRFVTLGESGPEHVLTELERSLFHSAFWQSSHRGGLNVYTVPLHVWDDWRDRFWGRGDWFDMDMTRRHPDLG